MADGDNDALDWIFDFVMHLFKSPAWEVPVMTFIDDSCVVFDNEDENKFAYTDSHNAFRELVDQLLGGHLTEIGVTSEDFADACASRRFSREVNQLVVEQLMAVDDFLTFKKMMVKRNMELELEAVRALKASTDQEGDEEYEVVPPDDDGPNDASEGEGSSSGAGGAEGEAREDEALEQAIQANLTELELIHKREEMEQLELEAAIAMSLALEEERIRIARAEAKASDALEQLANAQAAAAEAAALEEAREAKAERKIETTPESPVARSSKKIVEPESPPARSAKAVAKAVAEPSPQQPQSSSKASAPAKSSADSERPSSKASPAPAPAPAPAAAAAAPSPARAEPMPVASTSETPLVELQSQMQERQRVAQDTFRRNQEALRQQRAVQAQLQEQAEVSAAEVERRKAHLRAQRERIVAAKRAEREKRLREYEEDQKQQFVEPPPEIVHRLDPPADAKASEDDSEDRRIAMRVALAARMKADMLDAEDARIAKVQADQFQDLDAKLRSVEAAREDNRSREEELFRQLKAQQEQRARNLHKSARNLTTQGDDDFSFGAGML